jgi:hypothetical protein
MSAIVPDLHSERDHGRVFEEQQLVRNLAAAPLFHEPLLQQQAIRV